MRTQTALLAAFCACALLVAVHASVYKELVTENPSHPGQCFHSKTGKFYKNGEKWQVPGQCQEFTCQFPEIHGEGCSPSAGPKSCKIVEDKSKPYPACCPRLVCS